MITIACATDTKFYPFTAAMLSSVFEHAAESLVVYLLHRDLPEDVVREFGRFAEARGHQLHPIALEIEKLASLPVDKHASTANYYRLLLPEVLPIEVERVVYLDSDLLVRRPLNALWEQATSAKGLAAVREFHYERLHERRLGFPENSTYFNSGVMLIDLARWRADGITQEVIARIAAEPEKMEYWDQDGLNLVFMDAWRELPLEWNVQHGVFLDPRLSIRFPRLAAEPAIVHFTGDSKPWHRNSKHPYTEEFGRCFETSPFKNHYRPRLVTIKKSLSSMKRRAVALGSAVLRKTAAVEPLWRTYPLWAMSRLMDMRREHRAERESHAEKSAVSESIQRLVPDLTVQSGPFKGLKYGDVSAYGSMWSPKLLGCYEAELHPVVQSALQTPWDYVLDVGCAEGYYAVGFALFQNAPVTAFDIDDGARIACEKLAQLNGVTGRLTVQKAFTLDSLNQYGAARRGLILSDCEGAEKHIFHADAPGFALLQSCDLIIELHDFIEPGVSSYIHDLFAPTHEVSFLQSVDDLVRPRVFPSPLLKELSHEERVRLQAEHRPRAMEWAILRSRTVKMASAGHQPAR